MAEEPPTGREAGRPASGWQWSDDILWYRIKFVAGMAIVAVVALALYALFGR